jgi:hypothetical protein
MRSRTRLTQRLVEPLRPSAGRFATLAIAGLVALASTASAAAAGTCPADLNGDGVVNGADLGLLLAGRGQRGATDIDGSGITNGADLSLLLAAWGACPKPSPTTFVGVVALADGTPLGGAIVITDLGGTATTGKGGAYELSLMVGDPVESVTLTAIATVGGTTYQGIALVSKVALGDLNQVDPIVASPQVSCSGGFAWLPTLGVSAEVRAMTVFDDRTGPALYVGGSFTSAGGVAANRGADRRPLRQAHDEAAPGRIRPPAGAVDPREETAAVARLQPGPDGRGRQHRCPTPDATRGRDRRPRSIGVAIGRSGGRRLDIPGTSPSSRRMLRNLAIGLLICLFAGPLARAQEEGVSLPPGDGPVIVEVGFYLLNLNAVDERNKTFEADLYLSLGWNDQRLAFEGPADRYFFADAAIARLTEIWQPEIEFMNAPSPDITNRVLTIAPDGRVGYHLGLTSTFRTDLDLRRFPFDRQELVVQISSFMWAPEQVVLRVREDMLGFDRSQTFEGQRVTEVTATSEINSLTGWMHEFSEFRAIIRVQRNVVFFVWTVFVPVILTFLITSTLFYVPPGDFADRVSISLTGLLACIATQFAISFNLPQIDYLTVIDWLFVATYVCIAVSVLFSVVQTRWSESAPGTCRRINRWGQGVVAVLYLGLLVMAYFL